MFISQVVFIIYFSSFLFTDLMMTSPVTNISNKDDS